MALFARRIRGLQRLFPSSGMERANPTEVSDNVQLTAQWPSQAADLESLRVIEFLSGSAVTPVLTIVPAPGDDPANGTPAVGAETFDEWVFGDVRSTSAPGSTPAIALLLNAPGGLTTKVGVWSWDTGGLFAGIVPIFCDAVGGGTLSAVFSKRPILIPPGWSVALTGSTLGVAYTVGLRLAIVRRPLADLPLFAR